MKTFFNLIFLICFICCFSLIYPHNSVAGIDLPWTSTFNCAEWSCCATYPVCDGWGYALATTNPAELITTSANMAAGGGVRGQRHTECAGDRCQSGGLRVAFNTHQPEFWIRWYMRYEAGFAWNTLQYDKILYIDVTASSSFVVELYGSDGWRIWAQGSQHGATCNSCGWNTIMGGSVSDGQWHLFEFHAKMDTNGSNGIAQLWVDENLVIDVSDFDYNTNSNAFWSIMTGSNQTYVSATGHYFVDFDDFAISNTGYIGRTYGVPPSPPKNPRLQ